MQLTGAGCGCGVKRGLGGGLPTEMEPARPTTMWRADG